MYRSAREALLITHLYLYQVLILSYEAAQQHAALLKAAPPFALLVCDEAHRLKNRLQPYVHPGCNHM